MSEEELRKALEIMTKPMTLEKIKNFKYTFFDNSGDEESFTLEDYLDLSNKVYDLERENQQLKEEINKISKKELKVRDMLYSIENGTLTRERLMQIEEVLFELGENNEQ